ncbi:MAG: hypothetical protein LBT37_07800 [Lactobacillaceae bacterium]|jgi:hypothetical protein|nr:hypothetical protein [Lactobacillaceae bacterium]
MKNPGRNEELFNKVQKAVNTPVITFVGWLVLIFIVLYILIYGIMPVVGLLVPIPTNIFVTTEVNYLAFVLVVVGVAVIWAVATLLQKLMGKKK